MHAQTIMITYIYVSVCFVILKLMCTYRSFDNCVWLGTQFMYADHVI